MFLIAARAYFTGATALFSLFSPLLAVAQTLQGFSTATTDAPPAPWRVVALPGHKIAPTRFDIVPLDGQSVLRVRADQSYANLSHPVPPGTGTGVLRWKWRLDQSLPLADLRRKDGDDAAIKVCALFDLPLEKIGFVERNLLRLARSNSGEYLPAATLCYVWDPALPVGTELANAYTGRVRYQVLNSASTPLGQWASHSRNLAADFLRSFGEETDTVPPLLAIVVGADADNTRGNSLAYVGDVALVKQ